MTRRTKFIEAARTSANGAASLTSPCWRSGAGQSLDIKPVDINAAILLGMRILLDGTMGENVKIETRFDADGAVGADRYQPAGIDLLNLAINARDAMPEGGSLVLDDARLARGGGQGCVGPDGLGDGATTAARACRADVLANVFEPFFTTKPLGQGHGAGAVDGLWLRQPVGRRRADRLARSARVRP